MARCSVGETGTFDAGGMQVTLWRLPGYVGGEPQQPVPRDVVGVMVPIVGNPSVPADAPSHWSVDFWIGDVEAAAAKAAALGSKQVAPPYDVVGFRRSNITDPQGASFSVSQLMMA